MIEKLSVWIGNFVKKFNEGVLGLFDDKGDLTEVRFKHGKEWYIRLLMKFIPLDSYFPEKGIIVIRDSYDPNSYNKIELILDKSSYDGILEEFIDPRRFNGSNFLVKADGLEVGFEFKNHQLYIHPSPNKQEIIHINELNNILVSWNFAMSCCEWEKPFKNMVIQKTTGEDLDFIVSTLVKRGGLFSTPREVSKIVIGLNGELKGVQYGPIKLLEDLTYAYSERHNLHIPAVMEVSIELVDSTELLPYGDAILNAM